MHHGGDEIGALVENGVGDGEGEGGDAPLSADPMRQLSVRHLIKCCLGRVCRGVRDLPVTRARLHVEPRDIASGTRHDQQQSSARG